VWDTLTRQHGRRRVLKLPEISSQTLPSQSVAAASVARSDPVVKSGVVRCDDRLGGLLCELAAVLTLDLGRLVTGAMKLVVSDHPYEDQQQLAVN